MGAVETEHTSGRPSGVSTGFLFGNIDNRGRLDEDYMDEDAKDHLDNVAPTVADRDPNLREITAAVPKTKSASDDFRTLSDGENESGTDGEPENIKHVEGAEDFYDEMEFMEDLDEKERSNLASIALARAGLEGSNSQIPDDDENYDDDDDGDGDGDGENGEENEKDSEGTEKNPIRSLATSENASGKMVPEADVRQSTEETVQDTKLPVDVKVSQGLASPASNPAQSFTSSHEDDQVAAKTSRNARLSEEALQSELMATARQASEGAMTGPSVTAGGSEYSLPDDKPLKFSEILTQPRKKLPLAVRPKRYGLSLSVDDETSQPRAAQDDLLSFVQEPKIPRSDPIKIFLASDRASKHPDVSSGHDGSVDGLILQRAGRSPCGADDLADFGAPILPHSDKDPFADSADDPAAYSLIQQLPWEKEIYWQSSDDSSDDFNLSSEAAGIPAGKQMELDGQTRQGSPKLKTERPEGRQRCDSSDNKDGYKDKGEEEEDDDDNDDDDEEMEWEDGPDFSVSQVGEQSSSDPTVQVAPKDTLSETHANSLKDADPTAESSKDKSDSQGRQQSMSVPPSKEASERGAVAATVSPDKRDALEKLMSIPEPTPSARVADISIQKVLAPNVDLDRGTWLQDIIWDSSTTTSRPSDDETDDSKRHSEIQDIDNDLSGRTDRLILDMNDTNMIFDECVSPRASETPRPSRKSPYDYRRIRSGHSVDSRQLSVARAPVEPETGGACFPTGYALQNNFLDPFNVSNDLYYARASGSSTLKVDRRAILRGLRNAPPAVKAQTTVPSPSDDYLVNFHRPKLCVDDHPGLRYELTPFRRKRPKGGSSQIAGQIPKKQSELLASAKDAFRICLFEFALEHAPCLLPVPGMTSRVVTYVRKETSQAASQARKNATGTPDADTIYMGPEEVPPLHAGDILPNSKPLLVLESHLFSAPCSRIEPSETDFLVVRRRGKMYVREIDSVLSVGVTEPKLEIMAPNTDRFKKYAKDRVLLWLLREFLKSQKKVEGAASIDRETLFAEFARRRTFPETSLVKMLKELSRYQNGKYVLMEEPLKGFAAMEAEFLRTINPEETCAFEAMETGWHRLINVGVQIFTHPASQSNIRTAAEKTGLRAGPAVGNFIWNQLLKTPWYRSQIMIAAQKQQRKELIQGLAMARIVNDLREAGAIMEARIASLTAAETLNVLSNQYKLQARKIPSELEARRDLVRELALKRTKGSDAVNYQQVVAAIISKQRNVGGNRTAAGAGVTAAVAAGGVMIIPLDHQRLALDDGTVDQLPREEERATLYDDVATAAKLASDGDDAFGRDIHPAGEQKSAAAPTDKSKPHSSPSKSNKKATKPVMKTKEEVEAEEDEKELKKMIKNTEASGSNLQDSGPKKKKKGKRLKVTRKVTGPDGKKIDVVEYITDPAEVERMLAKSNARSAKKAHTAAAGDKTDLSADKKQDGGPGSSKLKIAINVRKLTEGAKSGSRKAHASSPVERKKSSKGDGKNVPASSSKDQVSKPSASEPFGSDSGSAVRKIGPKGQVGKIRINQRDVKRAEEEKWAKRKRSQYGEDLDYPMRKAPRKSATSRRKRNGTVILNGILEEIEKVVRDTEGYVQTTIPEMVIVRLRPGQTVPPGRIANNLARPRNSGLDFTTPVDVRTTPDYKNVVKKQMFLDLIKQKCKQMKYQSSGEFLKDMQLMLDNARAYNCTSDVKWVVRHAELLFEVAEESILNRKEDILAAEELVENERAEADAARPSGGSDSPLPHGTSASNSNGISSKISQKPSKSAKSQSDAPRKETGNTLQGSVTNSSNAMNKADESRHDASTLVDHGELVRHGGSDRLDEDTGRLDGDAALELPDMGGVVDEDANSPFV